MKKYRCRLIPDKDWIKKFDLTFEAENENEASSEALIQIKQNLTDYFNVDVDEVKQQASKQKG